MNILLGVCGSISSYKTYDLVRNLTQAGHQVIVVLTAGAEKFVKKETYRYLGAEQVYSAKDDFSFSKAQDVLHITLARWCERLVIAPLSAQTGAKLATGLCDDLLTSIYLSLKDKTCLFFPAMNTVMLEHPRTQENLQRLQNTPQHHLFPTEVGELICGEQGAGKLLDIAEIACLITTYPSRTLTHRKVVITTGATRAYLDPVRYLTNPASGLTGFELAKVFLQEGYHVVLIHGSQDAYAKKLRHHPEFTSLASETTEEMYHHALSSFNACELFIASAAVCDFKFTPQEKKIKKDTLATTLEVTSDLDILKTLCQKKTAAQTLVGFAAETDLSPHTLRKKMAHKPVSLLVGNNVHNGLHQKTPRGFAASHNQYLFLHESGEMVEENLSKRELAQKISSWYQERQILKTYDRLQ